MKDQRNKNPKKTKRTEDVVELVKCDIEEDRRVTLRQLAARYDMSLGSMQNLVTEQLGMRKKSARWVPKLLSEEQKEERVRCSQAFVKMAMDNSQSLNIIVTMDETAVSFHTPETKRQSKQWVKKGMPGPVKAKVHASRTKQMVLAFFDSRGMIYCHTVPRGKTVNGEYIIEVMKRFLKVFKRKRPEIAASPWLFHWDNAPVHTANNDTKFLAKNNIRTLQHPLYSPDLAPADYFLFRRLKSDLAGVSVTPETFKTELERVLRSIGENEFAEAFQRWLHRHEKCIALQGGYVEKS